jgi:hypothetical protein
VCAESKLWMRPCTPRPASNSGVTLMELLCVFMIITILGGLLLGAVNRALRRARAMQWSQDAPVFLDATVARLKARFEGSVDFPPVTLSWLETNNVLDGSHLGFLRDRRVTFYPFSGVDPDDHVVIHVRIEPGFLVEAGSLTAVKADITKRSEE